MVSYKLLNIGFVDKSLYMFYYKYISKLSPYYMNLVNFWIILVILYIDIDPSSDLLDGYDGLGVDCSWLIIDCNSIIVLLSCWALAKHRFF